MFSSFLHRLSSLIFSLNDPRWGNESSDNDKKQPNSAKPTELDELWQTFNERLQQLVKNKKGGSGNSNSPPLKNYKFNIPFLFLGIVLLWLASGFFIVQEGQVGVISTFGRYERSTTPGISWNWPYPIQQRELVNVSQMRMVEVGYHKSASNKIPTEALMLTSDENIVDVQFAVQYRLKDPVQWIFDNRDQEEVVKQVAETAVREVVGKDKMDFVLYEGREKVAADTSKLMQQILDRYRIGVQIINITMQNVQPPEQVQAAFDDAVKAGQDRERQKNEGQAYANNVIPRTAGAASRLLQEAEAYRSKVIANAQGNASRFDQVVAEYQKAPAITRDRMYLETMQQIFSSTTKILNDSKSGNSLLYLNFDKLLAKTLEENPTTSNKSPTIPELSNSGINLLNNDNEQNAQIQTRSQEIPIDPRARETRNLREREAR